MNGRIIKKVVFAKGKHFISISYEEGQNSKVLESDGIYNDSFAKKIKLSEFLSLTAGCSIRIKGITFATEKQRPVISFVVIYENLQFVNMNLKLINGERKSAQDFISFVIEEIRTCCDEYLGGVHTAN